MSANIILFVPLVLNVFFGFGSTSVNMKFDGETLPNEYARFREHSVHRGLLLSFSPARLTEVCRDLFNSPYYQKQDIRFGGDDQSLLESLTDFFTGDDEPLQHSVMVRKFTFAERPLATDELFLECLVEKFRSDESPVPIKYYISFAYQFNYFYTSLVSSNNRRELELQDYMALSPEHVPYEHDELERIYVRIRRAIGSLKKEAPLLVKQIEEDDDLMALTRDERISVCASILATSAYKDAHLQIQPHWIETAHETMEYSTRPLDFRNENYQAEDLMSNNVGCKAYNTEDEDEESVLYTRSYDDENSVFTLRYFGGRILLDKYFRNVPVLMNANRKLNRRNSHDQYTVGSDDEMWAE